MNGGINESGIETTDSIDEGKQRKTKWIKIETIEKFDQLLTRHPYLYAQSTFQKRYRRVVKYFQFKQLLIENKSISLADAARSVGIPETTAHYWKQKTVPILMKILLDNEHVLRSKEASLTSEYKLHAIPSYKAYDYFKTVSPTDSDIDLFSEIIVSLSKASQEQLCIVELTPHKGQQVKMQRIARYIAKKRNQIEKALEPRCNSGNRIRIGVLDDKLFIWRQRPMKKHFLLLADELFYFDKRERTNLIQRAQRHLGGIGDARLSELVRQMTGYTFSKRFPVDSINADLKHEKHYLSGRTLHFILDILNEDLHGYIQKVKKIGRQKQIMDPRILSNVSFDQLMIRLFAIIGSDGHIQPTNGRVQYSEWNQERRKRVSHILKKLGDVVIHQRTSKGVIIGLYLPSVIGRMLLKLGMPSGDKVLQGYNLPAFIMNASAEMKIGYFEELLPEEACLSIRENGLAYVILGRRVVLCDPSKSKKYEFSSKVSPKHRILIKNYGRKDFKKYGSQKVLEQSIVLSRRKLKEMSKTTSASHSASQLLAIINETPCKLLDDERKLLASIGIRTSRNWKEVTLYESGRISVLWEIRTKSQQDTALWGTLAPPNDVLKFQKFQNWLQENNDLVQQVESDGFIPT